MNIIIKYGTIAILSLAAMTSCEKVEKKKEVQHDKAEQKTLVLTPFENLNQSDGSVDSHAEIKGRAVLTKMGSTYVDNDQASLGLIFPNSEELRTPHYPRIKVLKDGAYMLMYQTGGGGSNGWDTFYSVSDDLKSWRQPMKFLFQRHNCTNSLGNADRCLYTNANAIVLPDGEILAFASFRAKTGYSYQKCDKDNGIMMKRSKDGGYSWTKPEVIYRGANWGSDAADASDGELQCYFSRSRPWISSGNSGTGMIISKDNGKTWVPAPGEEPYNVVRQNHTSDDGMTKLFTDQMPGVIQLNESKQLMMIVESKKTGVKNSQISLAYSDENGEWPHLTGDDVGPLDRTNYIWAGAAPTLCQFKSGEVAVFYGESNYFVYRIGDSKGREFGDASRVFEEKGYWGDCELLGTHSVIVTSPNGAGKSILTGVMALNHAVNAPQRTVIIDADNKEWTSEDDALYVGSGSTAKATLRCAQDEENYYFLAEVIDNEVSKDDYIQIFLADSSNDKLNSNTYKIKVSPQGLKNIGNYGGGWRELDLGVKAASAFDATMSDSSSEDNGWLCEVAVSKSSLNISDKCLVINFSLFDVKDGESSIIPTSVNVTTSWIPVL